MLNLYNQEGMVVTDIGKIQSRFLPSSNFECIFLELLIKEILDTQLIKEETYHEFYILRNYLFSKTFFIASIILLPIQAIQF